MKYKYLYEKIYNQKFPKELNKEEEFCKNASFPTVFANTMLEIEEIIIVNSIKTAIDFFNTLFFIIFFLLNFE